MDLQGVLLDVVAGRAPHLGLVVAGPLVRGIPGGVAAKIKATSGLGKVIVEPRFNKIDEHTYQSPDYEDSIDKVEITVSSGAGNVSVVERVDQYAAAAVRV